MDNLILQRSDEWLSVRAGKITASNFGVLIRSGGRRRSIWSREGHCYLQEVANTYKSGKIVLPLDTVGTKWGQEKEVEALSYLTVVKGYKIEKAGFVSHSKLQDIGATPDAFWLDEITKKTKGTIQIKCPFNSQKHLECLEKVIDGHSLRHFFPSNFWQVQGEMWVCELPTSLFVSYDPRQPKDKQMHIVEIAADPIAFEKLSNILPKAIDYRNQLLKPESKGDILND